MKKQQEKQSRQCSKCGKWYMTPAQLAHHEANAARLCEARP